MINCPFCDNPIIAEWDVCRCPHCGKLLRD